MYAFTAVERKIKDEGTICLAIFLWDTVKKLTIKDSVCLSLSLLIDIAHLELSSPHKKIPSKFTINQDLVSQVFFYSQQHYILFT